jgi:group I intron endonuclease
MTLPPTVRWTIYKIVNPNGSVYVGKTKNLKHRISVHRHDNGSDTLVKKSIREYGLNGHLVSVIEEFFSDEPYAYGKELFWIRTMMSSRIKWPEMNGLNMSIGGKGTLGVPASDRAKASISKRHTGRVVSALTRERISNSLKGIKRKAREVKESADHASFRTRNLKGQKREEAVRLKIHDANIRTRAKAIIRLSLSGDFEKEYVSSVEAARDLGLSRQTVARIIKRLYKKKVKYDLKYK